MKPLPRSKRLAMSLLLDNARKTEFQLWAENAPFEFKDALKGRGYRWDGAARCWYIVLDEAALPAEEEFLQREVCPGLVRPVSSGQNHRSEPVFFNAELRLGLA